MKELNKYEVDTYGRLYIDTRAGRAYPVDLDNGRFVKLTQSLLHNRELIRDSTFIPEKIVPVSKWNKYK